MIDAARTYLAMLAISLCVLAPRLEPASFPMQSRRATTRTKTSLRVGMWTLWRDRNVQVIPTATTTFNTCSSCEQHPVKTPVLVRADQTARLTLTIGNKNVPVASVTLNGQVTLSAHGESIKVYGPVTMTGRTGEVVIAVTLPVEQYVEQVVASESGRAETIESLKALAVVVRSYALHEAHGHADYDVCDSTHCQLLHWSGMAKRHSEAHMATLHTAGETLWFQGSRAVAYFNKDCGGHSAAINEVWPKAGPVRYLQSRTDRFCDGPGQQWASEMSRTEISAALAKHGLAAAGWQHLAVGRRAELGRAVDLRLDGSTISAEDFRIAVGESLGWNRIPSTWFEVKQDGERFYFHGRGWGHGVGLCQRGASAMGRQGRTAGEILDHYFPGTQVADECSGKTWTSLPGAGFTLETIEPADAVFLPELSRARAEASQRSGLNTTDSFIVRAFPSTSAFRDATVSQGWVAAFTEGDWIASQPLHILAARHLLVRTMRHEFLHALVEKQANAVAPLWLREGLVEVWSAPDESKDGLQHRFPLSSLEAVEHALAHPASEAESETAHRDAALYTRHLLSRYGRDQVISWLRTGVLPSGVLLDVAQGRTRR